jgi:hypothetical protein
MSSQKSKILWFMSNDGISDNSSDLQDLTVENRIDFTTDFKNCSENFWGAGQFSFQTLKQDLQAFYSLYFVPKFKQFYEQHLHIFNMSAKT